MTRGSIVDRPKASGLRARRGSEPYIHVRSVKIPAVELQGLRWTVIQRFAFADVASRMRAITMALDTSSVHQQGVHMGDKSPNHHNDKKVGKSLKEKRNDKKTKKDTKSGLITETK